MKTYYYSADVKSAQGWQMVKTRAASREEADENIKNHEYEFDSEEVEVTDMDDWEFNYEESDEG